MNCDISVGVDPVGVGEEPLRIGVRVPPCDRADRVARTVRRAEELGFDQVWFPDSQLLWRDVFTTLTAAAFATERIGLGTAVTNLATRHPSVVASAARSVAELAPGRFTLGLGVGNSSVGLVGLPQTGSAALREGLTMLRALLDGQEWDYEGKVRSRLRDPQPSVPLHLAAGGPRNLRLAGEIADGVILLSGVSPRTLTAATAVVGRPATLAHLPAPAKCLLASDLSAEAVGGPVDVVVDTVGGPVLRDARPLVRPRGRVALVGYTAGREFTVDLADFLLAGVSLLPVNLMTRGKEVVADAEALPADLRTGALTLEIERHGLDGFAEAAERLRSGEAVGKVVLELD
ncbi:LLM class flavin-dependent oxidoreductase [Streptomyces galilaeus]